MGYDSESKGYRIYWPRKESLSVERNVVFNQDDTNSSDNIAIIHGKVLSEGEKDKIIQSTLNTSKTIEQPENEEPEDQQTVKKNPEPHQSPKSTNTICFPTTDKPQNKPGPDPEYNHMPNPQYGCGQ